MKCIPTLGLALALIASNVTAKDRHDPSHGPLQAKAAVELVSQRLLMRHLDAFRRGNVDAILADYAADAVLITPDGVYRGHSEIRAFFDQLVPLFPTDGSLLEVDRTVFSGNLIYFIWHAKTPMVEVPFATDTLIVRGGKIARQTFAGKLNSAKQ